MECILNLKYKSMVIANRAKNSTNLRFKWVQIHLPTAGESATIVNKNFLYLCILKINRLILLSYRLLATIYERTKTASQFIAC